MMDIKRVQMPEVLSAREVIVTPTEARKHGFCVKGIKQLMESHGFNFKDFIKNGVKVGDIIDKTNDHHVMDAVRTALRREGYDEEVIEKIISQAKSEI